MTASPAEDGRILIVDDDQDILVAAKLLLKRHFPIVRTEIDPARVPSLLGDDAFDLILLDMNFTAGESSGREGLDWLQRYSELAPEVVILPMTAYGDVDMAVEAMKRGAFDFVVKPWENEKFLATVRTGLALKRSRGEASRLRGRNRELIAGLERGRDVMIGESEAMRGVWDLIRRAAPTDANVLILGENGTGKELVAREIHRLSPRTENVFMAVDLGEVPESLFESELFGHKKGAFTDAREDRVGRIQAAEGGTLFLDEIGNLSLAMQAKLLSVLERRDVRPVGGTKSVPIDIRLVCATNLPRAELSAEDRFRQDLLYRINTIEIVLPPLRKRKEDLPQLLDHFVALYARKYNLPRKGVSEEAMDKLMAYGWPGNVRELRHAVERATILSRGHDLGPEDFPLTGGEAGARSEAEGPDVGSMTLEEMERHMIEECLRRHTGNVSQAARDLGLTRASLYRRMEKYGL